MFTLMVAHVLSHNEQLAYALLHVQGLQMRLN